MYWKIYVTLGFDSSSHFSEKKLEVKPVNNNQS
jgi:hypothetical protein